MKIVKRMKGAVSWHFYKDEEMVTTIERVEACLNGEPVEPMKVLTNMLKGSDGDDLVNLYFKVSAEESRLYIDNEKKEMTFNISYDDVEDFLECLDLFLWDKMIGQKEMFRFFISKKEHALLGFNQQHKRFERIAQKREQERKMLDERRERCA